MKEETIRQRLNEYIEMNGVRAKFIAEQINLHQSTLSRWRKNKAALFPETLQAIENYLNNKGE